MSTPPDQNRFAPPTARVDDVPAGGPELAGRGSRFGAAFVDGLVQFIVSIVILLVLQGYLLATQGQTIGKKLLGIRIVRSDGSKVDAARVIGLRYALIWALAVIPVVGWVFGLVDALMIFRNSRKCLHDNIADTIVIKA